jgi:transposase
LGQIQIPAIYRRSELITTTKDNRSIVLFETNIGHAGEFIDSILHKRAKDCAKPIMMSDALPSNRPSQCDAIISLCNSHARRQFVDVISHFPDEVEHVLTQYGKIWTHDQESRAEAHTPAERLAYHEKLSSPIMAEIKNWGEERLANGDIEANSSLGHAVNYFIKHYEGLTHFCRTQGAKIDNNQIEAMLKIVVRDRKNAMFHKTLLGATIGDIVTSMIATASESGINVFDYFTTLQRESEQVRHNPENYLPWNYLENS